VLAFLPVVMSSPLTKIGIVYTQVLQKEMIPNDTQIREIDSLETDICTKMLRNLSEKIKAKFPVTTLSYSLVKIARGKDAFSEIF